MQKHNNYTEIEDFLANGLFQLWVKSKIHRKERTSENPDHTKVIKKPRLYLLAMIVRHEKILATVIQSGLNAI
jgi:hypothetical protein